MRNRLFALLCGAAGAYCVVATGALALVFGIGLWIVALILIASDLDRLFPGGEVARRILAGAFLCTGLYAFTFISEYWSIGLLSFGAALFSPDMAGFFATPTGGLFFPSGHASGRLRDYSHAQKAMAAGDYQAAVHAYRCYADEDPADQRVRLELARCYVQMQDRAAALYWFEKVVAFDARNELEALALREEVGLHLAARDETRAREIYRRLQRDFAGHPHTLAAQRLLAESVRTPASAV